MAERARQADVLRAHASTTSSALHLREGIPFESWLQVGHEIARISSGSAWWVGDWVVFGERAYRDRYRTALRATQLDYQTLRNYAWVARRFDVSRRRDNLSFQHHAEVAALPEPESDLWLHRAEQAGWSRNELRRQLAAARRPPSAASQRPSVRVQIEVGARREQRWREAATVAQQELAEWIASVADNAAREILRTRSRPDVTGRILRQLGGN
jgi:hypothetical protein